MNRYKTNLVDSKLSLVYLNRLNTLIFQYETPLRSTNNPINFIKKIVLTYGLMMAL